MDKQMLPGVATHLHDGAWPCPSPLCADNQPQISTHCRLQAEAHPALKLKRGAHCERNHNVASLDRPCFIIYCNCGPNLQPTGTFPPSVAHLRLNLHLD
jgi:hypothetical protein